MSKRFVMFVTIVGLVVGVLVAPTLGANEPGAKVDREAPAAPQPRAVTPTVKTEFVPVDPVRAFDSRVAAYPQSGSLAPNQSRVIPVKDGHNSFGTVTTPNAVPPGATAVSYNLTITQPTGPNFVAVTPGNAGFFSTSAINFNGTADVANAGVVTIDGQRQVKVWNGIESGTVHFIIDITGYYIGSDKWAKVDADAGSATLLDGHGATSVASINTGVVSVTFDSSVVGCGWLATRNDNLDGVAGPGEVSIELGSSADPATLWVRTFDSSGTQADPSSSDGFTLYVDC